MFSMKKLLILSAASLLVAIAMLLPQKTSAQDLFDDVCGSGTGDSAVCQDKNNSQSDGSNSFYGRNGVLTKIARIIAIVVGVASVIMIIIGGFKYVLANGDSNSINSAKNTILYAIIGLIISVIAVSIIQFVLSRL